MDFPRDEITRMAEAAIENHGGPEMARVYFKFTCATCGERCTFNEPNRLYTEGECHACGHMTEVTHAGFALHHAPFGFPPGM